MKYVIIIPSLNPDNKLVDLCGELKKNNLNDIIVINDGSLPEYNYIYEKLEKENVKVLVHNENKGKGAGIKNAINYMKTDKEVAGYITVDSDGQHKVKDVLKIIDVMKKDKDTLVLGVRDFNSKNVPFKSKYGNKFSSIYFYMQTGKKCPDTQTGLRGIPKSMEELALKTNGERYEYEMNFLTTIAINKLKLFYVPIQTIYENSNKGSHFRPFIDSFLIYQEWFKFLFSSAASAILDLVLFSIFINILSFEKFYLVLLSTIIARVLSGMCNFTLNRYFSFNNNGKKRYQIVKYIILFILQMFISGFIVAILSHIFTNTIIIKIVVDVILFVISYFMQKRFIFYNKV